jgi:hypothetical protein
VNPIPHAGTAISVAVVLSLAAPPARGQTAAGEASSSRAFGGLTFLAVDPYVGLTIASGYPGLAAPPSDDEDPASAGWTAGATLRFLPWLGVETSGGHITTKDQWRMSRWLVGPQVSSPFFGEFRVRGFAHVLVGMEWATAPVGPRTTSGEFVAGGGWDAAGVLRVEFDYVRRNIPGLPTNDGRLSIGGVVPLCLHGCRPQDGFRLEHYDGGSSSGPATPRVERVVGRGASYFSLSAGPSVQWFSPPGYVWRHQAFREAIVFPDSATTYGAFALSGGGFVRDRWALLFDIDGRVPGAAKAGNVLVGLSVLRPVSSRFRLQGGAGFGGLVAQHGIIRTADEASADDDTWQAGVGAYGGATYDIVRFGDWALHVQARGSIATYELLDIRAVGLQIGVSR